MGGRGKAHHYDLVRDIITEQSRGSLTPSTIFVDCTFR
jgi:hypothetical protein